MEKLVQMYVVGLNKEQTKLLQGKLEYLALEGIVVANAQDDVAIGVRTQLEFTVREAYIAAFIFSGS